MQFLKKIIQKREFTNLKIVKEKIQFIKTAPSDNYIFYPPSYPQKWLSAHLKPLIIDQRRSFKQINAVDLACGTGQFSTDLTQLFDKVLGIDTNENQLKIAEKIGAAEIQKAKLEFKKVEYSKSDEILSNRNLKFDDYKFVFLAQGFERYDYEKFITSFREAVPENDKYLVLLGFPIFTILPESDNLKKDIFKFSKEILSFYQFNPFSLPKEYKDIYFNRVFEFVQFSTFMDEIKGDSVLDFLRYLDSWGAYRNYLEFNKGHDPLLELMESWGLKNFGRKDFSKIELSENSPLTISYRLEYFMYILK